MKKTIVILSTALAIVSCKKEPKDYATVSGKIDNIDVPADSVHIFDNKKTFHKAIKLNDDGTFSDTLKVKKGDYMFKIGNEYGSIFLENNDDITISTDYSNFDKDLKFTGSGFGIDPSNFYVDLIKLNTQFFDDDALNQPKDKFDATKKAYQEGVDKLMNSYPNISDSIKSDFKKNIENQMTGLQKYYESRRKVRDKFTGKPAPAFAMEDIDGKTVKLSDFKGKYVYVDIWATWCGPCKMEIPALKKLEEEYSSKNIVFVSMSVDEPKNKEIWSTFVKEKDLQGVQIFTNQGWQAPFVTDLEVRGIPRFVLISPEGLIVDPDAPRPSSKRIKKTLEKLLS